MPKVSRPQQLDADRSESWQTFVCQLFQGLGYEHRGPGPLSGTIILEGPSPGLGGPPGVIRWLVLCRAGPRAPVLTTDDLISAMAEAQTGGVIGLDFPESDADQKQQFEALPASVARQSIDPQQFVRDNIRDPDQKERYLKAYQDLAVPPTIEGAAALLDHPAYWVFWSVFFWALIAAAVQHGIVVPLLMFGGLLVVAFLLGASGGLVGAAAQTWGPYVVALVGIPVMLSWLVGPYNGWRDWVIALATMILVAIFGSRLVSPILEQVRRTDPDEQQLARRVWRRRSMAAIWLVVTWTAVSIADAWFGPSWWSPIAALDRPRLLDTQPANPDRSRVGVALSGGGYRAALFHAGVLAALEEERIPIDGLSSVSGGSIIGGYYALGGDPRLFRDAVAEGRFNLKRELLGIHNFIRLPCPGRIALRDRSLDLFWFCAFGRDDVQGALLDRNLYSGLTLEKLAHSKYPRWIIAGTDLVTGQAVGFSADGILRLDQAAPRAGLVSGTLPSTSSTSSTSKDLGDLANTRIARLVAASGAFPGAFQASVFKTSPDADEILVSDGGLTDNFGFSLLASAHKLGKGWTFDLILVSDGGESFKSEVSRGIGQLGRAMNVVYASAGIGADNADPPPEVLRLSPQLLDSDNNAMTAQILGFYRAESERPAGSDLSARIDRCKAVFNDTSTLKDQITPDDAQCIFDLGVYTVAANLQEIRVAMATPYEGSGLD